MQGVSIGDNLHEMSNISQNGMPFETNNTRDHEIQRLGLIESLHMQHCSLRGCIRPR